MMNQKFCMGFNFFLFDCRSRLLVYKWDLFMSLKISRSIFFEIKIIFLWINFPSIMKIIWIAYILFLESQIWNFRKNYRGVKSLVFRYITFAGSKQIRSIWSILWELWKLAWSTWNRSEKFSKVFWKTAPFLAKPQLAHSPGFKNSKIT